MSKKKDAKVAEVTSPTLKKPAENDPAKLLGLTISSKGFKLELEGFMMCKEIFAMLYEKLDEELMKKRVDREFKGYAIQNAIQISMHALNISNITNDVGDSFKEYPIYDFGSYDYVEESTEPPPPGLDSHGKSGILGDPKEYNCRFRVSQFNKRFNEGLKRPPPRSPSLKSVRFNGRSTKAALSKLSVNINKLAIDSPSRT